MSNSKIKGIKKELEEIRQNNDGIITPEMVVNYARDKKTALHSHFEWDEKKAAGQYRIEQAKLILRSIKVEVLQRNNEIIEVRQYVSLPSDRGNGGIYRTIETVLTEDDKRIEYLESVKSELESFRKKLKLISQAASSMADKIGKEIEREINNVSAKKRVSA